MGCKVKSEKSMYRLYISVSLAAWMVVSAAGCYLDKEEILYPGSNLPADCAITPSKFAADVQPLMVAVTTKVLVAFAAALATLTT